MNLQSRLMDHQYFYVKLEEPRKGHAVPICDLASDMLAACLQRNSRDAFLEPNCFTTCQAEQDPIVRGLIAEKIVIGLISKNGLLVDGQKYQVQDTVVIEPGRDPYLSAEVKVVHFVPARAVFNYPYIDSLIRIVTLVEGALPALILVAQQTTLQSVPQHLNTLKFFEEAYKKWEGDPNAYSSITWVWLWIASSAGSDVFPCKNESESGLEYRQEFINFTQMDQRLSFLDKPSAAPLLHSVTVTCQCKTKCLKKGKLGKGACPCKNAPGSPPCNAGCHQGSAKCENKAKVDCDKYIYYLLLSFRPPDS